MSTSLRSSIHWGFALGRLLLIELSSSSSSPLVLLPYFHEPPVLPERDDPRHARAEAGYGGPRDRPEHGMLRLSEAPIVVGCETLTVRCCLRLLLTDQQEVVVMV